MFFALGFCGLDARTAVEPSPTIRPFALRHKQFASHTLLERAKDFLGSRKSYRQAVCANQRALTYADRQAHSLAARGAALAHSRLWRWLSWLGELTRTIQAAGQLIDQKDPDSTLHRQVIPIDPRKYRSEPRRVLLEEVPREEAGALLRRLAETERLFPNGQRKEPSLATLWRKWTLAREGGFEVLADWNSMDCTTF